MVFRENKEKFETQQYQLVMNGKQIQRILDRLEDNDIPDLKDVEDLLNEAVETLNLYRVDNPQFFETDSPNNEYCIVVNRKERTMRVTDIT